MPLVFSDESRVLRVDGDVLETFIRGESEQRVLLALLAVQVSPLPRGYLAVQIGSASPEAPLYQVLPKAKPIAGRGNHTLQVTIRPEDEPRYREFFTQVAQLCGRPVVP
jgi:hypothetical protein